MQAPHQRSAKLHKMLSGLGIQEGAPERGNVRLAPYRGGPNVAFWALGTIGDDDIHRIDMVPDESQPLNELFAAALREWKDRYTGPAKLPANVSGLVADAI